MSLDFIEKAVKPLGLRVRGGFHPTAADGVPGFSGFGKAGTLILIGNAGPEMWEAFTGAVGEPREDDPHPLDSWTRRVLDEVAGDMAKPQKSQGLKARALFPFDGPPYLPFQRWAEAAEGLKQSPIGPMMHPEFGLWHAYRGALVFEESLDLPSRDRPGVHPCDGCADQPCLSACPVGAIRAGAYDIQACLNHVRSAAGGACRDGGCLARCACPVAPSYAYGPDQARFHFQRFLAAHPPIEKKV
jgi:hypothetical protein